MVTDSLRIVLDFDVRLVPTTLPFLEQTSFQTLRSILFFHLLSTWRRSAHLFYCVRFLGIFQNPSVPSLWSPGPYCFTVPVREKILPAFPNIVDFLSYCLLNSTQIIFLQKARCNHNTNKQVMGYFLPLMNLARENQIALQDFLKDLNDISDKWGVCEYEAARVLFYFVLDGAKTCMRRTLVMKWASTLRFMNKMGQCISTSSFNVPQLKTRFRLRLT